MINLQTMSNMPYIRSELERFAEKVADEWRVPLGASSIIGFGHGNQYGALEPVVESIHVERRSKDSDNPPYIVTYTKVPSAHLRRKIAELQTQLNSWGVGVCYQEDLGILAVQLLCNRRAASSEHASFSKATGLGSEPYKSVEIIVYPNGEVDVRVHPGNEQHPFFDELKKLQVSPTVLVSGQSGLRFSKLEEDALLNVIFGKVQRFLSD